MTARVRVPVGAEAGWLALDEARRLPRNPKRHDVGAIASSVARFGVLEIPVINRRTGRLLAGHGRIDALQAMKAQGRRAPRGIRVGPAGRWLVFVRWVDLPEREEEAAALALNRTHDLGGGYDDQVLVQILADLAAGGDGALAGTGYDADDVDALLRGQLAEAERTRAVLPPEEPAAGPAEACQARWQVQPGDVWEIPGAHAVHRLVCGDATDPATWTALFRPGTPRAACVFTDPPYGVDHQPERKGPVAGDALRGDAYTQLLVRALTLAVGHAADEAAFYVWHASERRREVEWALAAAGLEERQQLVWVKEHFRLGRSDYHYQHEPCLYAQKAGQRARWLGDRTQATVWRLTPEPAAVGAAAVVLRDGVILATGAGRGVYLTPRVPWTDRRRRVFRPGPGERVVCLVGEPPAQDTWLVERDPPAEYFHPTQKPAALAVRALRQHTTPGDVVCDPFAGSGSTLLAAEQEGRLGLGIELEPRYVAVGLERFVAAGRCPSDTAPRRVGDLPTVAGRPGRRRPDRGERRT